MDNNRILKQFHAVFGIFMVMFYLGVGILLLFFAKMFIIDKAIRVIIGSTFIFYGLYRIYVTWKQITRAFFSKDQDEE
jgi:glucan phosphoethanolaminetransferase (alkaline phosphatase superfamily)